MSRLSSTPIQIAHMMYHMSGEDNLTEAYAVACMALDAIEDSDDGSHTPPAGTSDTPVADPSALLEDIRRAVPQDPILQSIITAKRKGALWIPHKLIHGEQLRLELGDCNVYNGLLYVRGKVYVPNVGTLQTQVLD